MYLPLFVGVLCLSLFLYALLVSFLVGLLCVIVLCPDHTHLLLERTQGNAQQNMEQTHTPQRELQSTTNQQQQTRCPRTDISQSH